MSIEFEGDKEYFTTDNIVTTDGFSQSRCLWWKYVDGQNEVMMILPVSGLGVARVNHNAIFCIFALYQKIPLHTFTKAFNKSRIMK